MATAQLIFIILTVFALSAGQILFKLASTAIVWSPAGFAASVISTKLLFALVVYAIATLMWLFALKTVPLRVAYPFMALAFVIVPLLAHYLLGEHIGWNTFVGAVLIAAGVWLSVYK